MKKVLDTLEQHGSQLHALLVRLTLRYDVADDLMQELFLRLARTRTFGSARDPAAYASRVAINLAMDWRRRSLRHKSSCCLSDDMASRSAPPLVAAVQAERMEQVLDAMSELGGLGPQVLVRHYVQQEPYESIARELARSPHHLRSLASKTLRKLRSRLGIRAVPEGESS